MQQLKEHYKPDMSLADAEKLVLKTLKQVMEDALTTDNVGLCVISAATKKLEFRDTAQIQAMLAGL